MKMFLFITFFYPFAHEIFSSNSIIYSIEVRGKKVFFPFRMNSIEKIRVSVANVFSNFMRFVKTCFKNSVMLLQNLAESNKER